ncbi:Stk1 family PASTA domain-containing Ser/Thr kinase [Jeotgalibacillus soli]|uniref:Serine/threonine-protein kinase PrkC n=1 Tax=Jeotgalibacillus soli TaxID=889306 RepID=A0A0C2R3J8_9BACL|nr:Stk1 family PASTA domain-containing Ser/Thr kinase [Jeotgalibacillus soli]KIL44840.1 non-spific serine/threonine protein kinase [Jeotgalibacillus soli]
MLIGRRLSGRYKILQTIGGGGMANVYLAHDMILDRDVAVKVLRLDYVSENELMKRFQREAQSATSLTHPNIVSMYDVGDEGELYYLVMEYVDGMTLKEYIQRNSPVSLEHAIQIMSQLTDAISHAHHNGIIHRDIKPQNILVDHEGHIKITDFGIAMALSATSITQTNSVMGTVHYLSPEQARGGIATKKSDIYSLGIVMFELITGRLPFEGESAVSIALKHLQSEIPHPSKWIPNLPQSVENVILKATTKDSFYRYESADEMQEDLKTVLDKDRENEPVFTVEPDNDATRAIPVIRDERSFTNMADTKVRNESTVVQSAKDPVEQQEAPKRKRKKWPWIVLVTLLLILISVSTMAAMGVFGPTRIELPDVVGETREDAEDILEGLGFTIGEVTYEPHEEIPAEEVLRTDPKAGRVLEEGSEISLFVSSGKETIELDSYTGRIYEDIESLLNRLKFEGIEIERVYDSTSIGTILEQDPAPGEEIIPSETTLRLTLSQGEETVAVESLVGMNASEIDSFEQRTGLVVNVTREEFSAEQPEGVILSQDPAEGTELEVGRSVNVVVSRGPEPLPPSTVIVPLTILYEMKEEPPEEGEDPPEVPGEPMPQTIRIFIEDRDRNMTEPVEEFTITETTEKNIRLIIEAGQTGGYRVERDGEIILEQSIPYDENQ